jgi:hypothetical protein
MMRYVFVGVVAVSSLIGCASTPKTATTTLTAAEPAAAVAQEPEPTTAKESAPADSQVAAPAATTDAYRPAGTLTCRTKSEGSTAELYLTWDGPEAKGILRTVAPSGEVRDLKVRAQRASSYLIVDDIYEKDMMVHAAVLRDHGGKKYVRLGETTTACE